jgi:hypothetical protein
VYLQNKCDQCLELSSFEDSAIRLSGKLDDIAFAYGQESRK